MSCPHPPRSIGVYFALFHSHYIIYVFAFPFMFVWFEQSCSNCSCSMSLIFSSAIVRLRLSGRPKLCRQSHLISFCGCRTNQCRVWSSPKPSFLEKISSTTTHRKCCRFRTSALSLLSSNANFPHWVLKRTKIKTIMLL